jgi:hypothetical protein
LGFRWKLKKNVGIPNFGLFFLLGRCITTMSLVGTLKGRGDNPKNNISLVDCKGGG